LKRKVRISGWKRRLEVWGKTPEKKIWNKKFVKKRTKVEGTPAVGGSRVQTGRTKQKDQGCAQGWVKQHVSFV